MRGVGAALGSRVRLCLAPTRRGRLPNPPPARDQLPQIGQNVATTRPGAGPHTLFRAGRLGIAPARSLEQGAQTRTQGTSKMTANHLGKPLYPLARFTAVRRSEQSKQALKVN